MKSGWNVKKKQPKVWNLKKKNYNPILLYMNIYIYRYFTCTLIFLCNGNQIFATCKHTLNCLIVCVLFFQSLDTQILSIQHWILKLSTTKDIPYQVLCKIINPSRSIIYRFKISVKTNLWSLILILLNPIFPVCLFAFLSHHFWLSMCVLYLLFVREKFIVSHLWQLRIIFIINVYNMTKYVFFVIVCLFKNIGFHTFWMYMVLLFSFMKPQYNVLTYAFWQFYTILEMFFNTWIRLLDEF